MRKRISPATVISCVALFFSLGGTAFAATWGHSGPSSRLVATYGAVPSMPSPSQVRKAVLAYAATESGIRPTLDCKRSSCTVTQGLQGRWQGDTLTYVVNVKRVDNWLVATSPLFAGSVRTKLR